MTASLLAGYVALFLLMTLTQAGWHLGKGLAGLGGIDIRVLVDFGALDLGAVTQHGQYWRMLTATFLHASVVHLLFNGFALYQLGQVIEYWFGGAALLALHVLLGLAGNVASIWHHLDREAFVQVGASGALFGFVAFICAITWRRRNPQAAKLHRLMFTWMILSLLFGASMGADNAAHIGGAIAGAAVGIATNLLGFRTLSPVAARLAAGLSLTVVLVSFGFDARSWAQGQQQREARQRLSQAKNDRVLAWAADQQLRWLFSQTLRRPQSLALAKTRERFAQSLSTLQERLTDAELAEIVEETATVLTEPVEGDFPSKEQRERMTAIAERYLAWAKRTSSDRTKKPQTPVEQRPAS